MAAIKEASRFFMKKGDVYHTLKKITRRLEDLKISYAVVGGMALTAYGHNRSTVDVDILVTAEGLKTIHEKLEGLGYVAPFAGSKNLKDVETDTKIEFLIAGAYPGDGKPKPVSFPDPATCAIEIDGHKFLNLKTLIELKLSSGMTGGTSRGHDFRDVYELIRISNLNEDYSNQLNPYVREKYKEIWQELQRDLSKPE
jgi:hypothetical protein